MWASEESEKCGRERGKNRSSLFTQKRKREQYTHTFTWSNVERQTVPLACDAILSLSLPLSLTTAPTDQVGHALQLDHQTKMKAYSLCRGSGRRRSKRKILVRMQWNHVTRDVARYVSVIRALQIKLALSLFSLSSCDPEKRQQQPLTGDEKHNMWSQ